MTTPTRSDQAAEALYAGIEEANAFLPIDGVMRLLADTLAGFAIAAGCPPSDEEEFIRMVGTWIRAAFNRRQALEIAIEQDRAKRQASSRN